MLVVDWFYLRQVQRQPANESTNLPVFNQVTISKYNGNDANIPIYLALDGYVYDVSAGRENFYAPGESYHDIVGKDSSVLLHVFGADIIKKKYKIVGVYKK